MGARPSRAVSLAVDMPHTREELIGQGLSPREANRQAVRQSLSVALEVGFERWGRAWICAVIFLILGMVGVLIWSEMLYDQHASDECDQPLAQLLRALYVMVAIHTFQHEIIRHLLCYAMSADGPIEPCRVALFRRGKMAALLLWPVVGTYMLQKTNSCSPQLQNAVRVIIIYYAVVAVVALILPMCFISVMLLLVRRGLIRVPLSRNAAPEGLCDSLEKVGYEPELFNDEREGAYPTSCAICLAPFDATESISRTPCPSGMHAFHTECLRGWLQCARTCPCCRHDLTTPSRAATPLHECSSIELAA